MSETLLGALHARRSHLLGAVGALLTLAGCGPDLPTSAPAGRAPAAPALALAAATAAPFAITATSATLAPGQVVTLVAGGTAVPQGTLVAWRSSNPAVATADPWTGRITGVAPGSVVVTATAQHPGYPQATTTLTVTAGVTAGATTFAVTPASPVLAPGQGITLAASGGGVPAGAQMVWRSSSLSVATVNATTGRVTAVSSGAVTITGTAQYPGYPQASTVVLVTTNAGTPAPAAPAVLPTGAAAVFALMGVSPSVASVEARGGAWAKYEQNFRQFGDLHWIVEGAGTALVDIVSVDYYDRAMIYYVWWARTGNAEYLARANAIALAYRRYVEQASYNVQAHNAQLDGLALHYLVTGDEASRTAIGRVAAFYATPAWLANLADRTKSSNRVQARVLHAYLLAWYLKAPSATGHPWGMWLREGLTHVLSTQAADGAYRFQVNCNLVQPFQLGMVNDLMIRYHDLFERDPRILTSVKAAVDFLGNRAWLSTSKAFYYLEGSCTGVGSKSPAPDLNNMIVSGFGWVARMTGNTGYYSVADEALSANAYTAYLVGSKQFNESYTSSFRYLGLRF